MKKSAALEAINAIPGKEWDPLGDSPEPEEEYRLYCSGIYRFMKKGADRVGLADHLQTLAAESMASPILRERVEQVADGLLAPDI